MSGPFPSEPSPSNSKKHTNSRETSIAPEHSTQQTSSVDRTENFTETPQQTAGLQSQPPVTLSAAAPGIPLPSSHLPDQAAPLIIITQSSEAHSPERKERAASVPRQSRPLVSRHRTGHSSSQPPRRPTTPYSRPRARSESRRAAVAMSSAASSPGNTSTSGATSGSGSGSNPSYHLPYAPFPYPMPGNARGSGQGNQGSGSGK